MGISEKKIGNGYAGMMALDRHDASDASQALKKPGQAPAFYQS